uniref:ParB/RepB/Spo0J family partition protein n=1 Tax=Acidovorax sp. SUPP3334 TaxID=2920881 RepID=UPI002952935B|nr:ParB/RepB/Spo0J family partition protein [Acidovorax sp. SUPP3334]BDH38323.1 ParB/RepB/Spo0J family partition protein [Acidovorax sp. SUPP3334]
MTSALKNSIARLGSKLEEHKKDAVSMKAGIDSLTAYAAQARTVFDDETLRELADSIKDIGVIEPLLVRPIGGNKYEIIAGERRWRAARLAGLSDVPVLVRTMDDVTADKVHLAENIHRENLSTLDLAQRVQRDLDAASGNLAVVAAKYSKGKPWVSKLSAIAQGGDSMTDLVSEGVTSDRAVLATVASLERKAPDRAKELGEQLKAAPVKANKRAIAEQFMKAEREATPKGSKSPKRASSSPAPKAAATSMATAGQEPAWRSREGVDRDASAAVLIVELSPASVYTAEFGDLSKKFGRPGLVTSVRHPEDGYAIVEFGRDSAVRRVYRADELRLLSVS